MSEHIHIGGLLFPDLDQADFTGPFEILARLPDSTFHVLGKNRQPLRDALGLILTPEMTLEEAPPLDVLVVPGGNGVNAAMGDAELIGFLKKQASRAQLVLSVCTGSLLCGAAGLLHGRRATCHWASHHLLAGFGAIPVNERVVVDGNMVTAAGVTSGLDGALRAAAILRGPDVARQIQLYLQYAPEPPFHCGDPATAPDEIRRAVEAAMKPVLAERAQCLQRWVESQGNAHKA